MFHVKRRLHRRHRHPLYIAGHATPVAHVARCCTAGSVARKTASSCTDKIARDCVRTTARKTSLPYPNNARVAGANSSSTLTGSVMMRCVSACCMRFSITLRFGSTP